MTHSVLSWEAVARRDRQARPLIMAHRGAADDAPENTLAAFALALEQGADVLETDLRFTRDNAIVLLHDVTLDRTTNGCGRVSDLTLAEVKRLRARQPNTGTLSDQEVPTLAELLALTRGEIPVALELKDPRFAHAENATRLVTILQHTQAMATTVLVSFHLPLLLAVKAVAPTLPIGMITLANPFPLYPTAFLGPFFPLLYANPVYVWWARRLGKIVCPLDPSPEPRLRFYRWLGVPVLLTNHPGRTVQALAGG